MKSCLFAQILFKSRCDNRLNEVTESVATDRREVKFLSHLCVSFLICDAISFIGAHVVPFEAMPCCIFDLC